MRKKYSHIKFLAHFAHLLSISVKLNLNTKYNDMLFSSVPKEIKNFIRGKILPGDYLYIETKYILKLFFHAIEK